MAAMRIALRSRNRQKSYGEDDEKLQICHSQKEKLNKKRKKALVASNPGNEPLNKQLQLLDHWNLVVSLQNKL